jgi:ATP-dependent protease La (LON) substrate-binding domain
MLLVPAFAPVWCAGVVLLPRSRLSAPAGLTPWPAAASAGATGQCRQCEVQLEPALEHGRDWCGGAIGATRARVLGDVSGCKGTYLRGAEASVLPQPRRRPRACASSLNNGRGDARVLPIVTAPMTGGADVLFPGGSQHTVLTGDHCVDVMRNVAAADPPEFGFIPVDAWGAACEVGTLAVIEDLELCVDDPEVALVCSGIARFRVIELAADRKSATVALFHDDPVAERDVESVQALEESILSSLNHILRISIKIAGVEDAPKRFALLETMKRMDAFALGGGTDPAQDMADPNFRVLQHWMVGMDADRRRELLSFIILDLLSMSFMDRREVLMSTNTMERMQHAHHALQPYLKQLAAKGAIVSALGTTQDSDNII